jgi:hypothetical protein
VCFHLVVDKILNSKLEVEFDDGVEHDEFLKIL